MFIRPKVVSFTGATVLITGGATGIGRLMALGAADRGAKAVIIWNRNATRGQEVVDELKAAHPHIQAKHYSVDVSDAESVHSNAQAVLAEFERVDILINNAGVVNGKPVLELSEEEIRRTVEVNTLSLFRTVREFLPGMLQRDYGSIVTISSAAGLVGVAKQSDYNVSKFGAVGFTQSLRAELRKQRSNVHTLLYCPYYISTGMFDGVKTKFSCLLPILKPQDCADQVLDAIAKGTQMKVNPPIVRLVQIMHAFPVPIVDAALEFFGIHKTMEDFTGRQ